MSAGDMSENTTKHTSCQTVQECKNDKIYKIWFVPYCVH